MKSEQEIQEAIALYTAALAGAGGPVPGELLIAFPAVVAALYWVQGVTHVPGGGPPVPIASDLDDIRRAIQAETQRRANQPTPRHN